MYPDDKMSEAVPFLRNAVAYYAELGISIKRLLTDNGSAFRTRRFAAACAALGIRHKFTRALLSDKRPGNTGLASLAPCCCVRREQLAVRESPLLTAPHADQTF